MVSAGPWSGFEDLSGFDKVEHAGANIAIVDVTWGVAALFEAPLWLRITAATSTAAAISVGKELWDAAGHGDPSLGDLTFDGLGIAAGVGFALACEAVLAVRGQQPPPDEAPEEAPDEAPDEHADRAVDSRRSTSASPRARESFTLLDVNLVK